MCTDNDVSAGIGTIPIGGYAIASGDDVSPKFSMTGANVLTSAVSLDYETKTAYTLLINVRDGGTPVAKTSTATVLVYVSTPDLVFMFS
jgi:hypothetical protein